MKFVCYIVMSYLSGNSWRREQQLCLKSEFSSSKSSVVLFVVRKYISNVFSVVL